MWASTRSRRALPTRTGRREICCVSDQLTLIVKKLSIPAWRSSCGSAGEKPKQSGSQQTFERAPNVALEISLAIKQLARQAFAGRHVGVGLDPHAADRLPLRRLCAFADAREKRGIVLLDLPVIMRGRLVEAELRRALDQ